MVVVSPFSVSVMIFVLLFAVSWHSWQRNFLALLRLAQSSIKLRRRRPTLLVFSLLLVRLPRLCDIKMTVTLYYSPGRVAQQASNWNSVKRPIKFYSFAALTKRFIDTPQLGRGLWRGTKLFNHDNSSLTIPFALQIKVINLAAGEHKTDEFTKLNPQQKVPTVDDDGFVMSESRAIMAYLVNEKCPDSTLYPADAKTRFVIDQRLYYDATAFSPRCYAAIVMSILTFLQLRVHVFFTSLDADTESRRDRRHSRPKGEYRRITEWHGRLPWGSRVVLRYRKRLNRRPLHPPDVLNNFSSWCRRWQLPKSHRLVWAMLGFAGFCGEPGGSRNARRSHQQQADGAILGWIAQSELYGVIYVCVDEHDKSYYRYRSRFQ